MKISLRDFRDDVKNYKSFKLEVGDPLSALEVTEVFDEIVICLSAYPCVALKNQHGCSAIKFINTISKVQTDTGEFEYIFKCREYKGGGDTYPVHYSLICQ